MAENLGNFQENDILKQRETNKEVCKHPKDNTTASESESLVKKAKLDLESEVEPRSQSSTIADESDGNKEETSTGVEENNTSQMSNDSNSDDDDNISEISGISYVSIDDLNAEARWRNVSVPISWVQRQMMLGVDPRNVLEQLIPGDVTIPPGVDSMTLWKAVLELLTEPPRRKKLPDVNLLEDVVNLILTSQNIMVLTGAGVSVSCGIPDFRSRDGIYSRLAVEYPDLPDPQAMFDIRYFTNNQKPFFKFAKEIYPGQFQPSVSHKFIALLEKHGKLLRNFTQNIDTLEQVAGISRVVQCHGSFAMASCMTCKHKVDHKVIEDDIMNQVIPRCPRCPPDAPLAVMKPDIVFFGESLPEEFHHQMEQDRDQCDLLIVMGSSLKVRPVALIPTSLPEHVPQILINREPLNHLKFDVELLGNCDYIVQELCLRLGDKWTEICTHKEPARQIFREDMPNSSAYQPPESQAEGKSEDSNHGNQQTGSEEAETVNGDQPCKYQVSDGQCGTSDQAESQTKMSLTDGPSPVDRVTDTKTNTKSCSSIERPGAGEGPCDSTGELSTQSKQNSVEDQSAILDSKGDNVSSTAEQDTRENIPESKSSEARSQSANLTDHIKAKVQEKGTVETDDDLVSRQTVSHSESLVAENTANEKGKSVQQSEINCENKQTANSAISNSSNTKGVTSSETIDGVHSSLVAHSHVNTASTNSSSKPVSSPSISDTSTTKSKTALGAFVEQKTTPGSASDKQDVAKDGQVTEGETKEDGEEEDEAMRDLKAMWRPKHVHLATELPENTFLYLPPSRYIFQGAEYLQDLDDVSDGESSSGADEDEDESSSVGRVSGDESNTQFGSDFDNVSEDSALMESSDSQQGSSVADSKTLPALTHDCTKSALSPLGPAADTHSNTCPATSEGTVSQDNADGHSSSDP